MGLKSLFAAAGVVASLSACAGNASAKCINLDEDPTPQAQPAYEAETEVRKYLSRFLGAGDRHDQNTHLIQNTFQASGAVNPGGSYVVGYSPSSGNAVLVNLWQDEIVQYNQG